MFESIPQNAIQAASTNLLSGGSAFSGPDIMTAVEMMLVKDYDDQLKSTAAEMKTMTKVKKAYRELIQKLNSFLTRTAKEVDINGNVQGEGDQTEDLKPSVALTQSEIDENLNQTIDYVGDPNTLSVSEQTQEVPEGDLTPVSEHDGQLYVEKEAIVTVIENYKMKLDTLNEQTEITSLSLQTLTNQRKVAFEAVSNIIKKQEDGVETIIRNIS